MHGSAYVTVKQSPEFPCVLTNLSCNACISHLPWINFGVELIDVEWNCVNWYKLVLNLLQEMPMISGKRYLLIKKCIKYDHQWQQIVIKPIAKSINQKNDTREKSKSWHCNWKYLWFLFS